MENLNLSYTMKKKTEKLLKLKNELDNKKGQLILSSGFTGMLVVYVGLSNDRYFDYAAATFNPSIPQIYGLEFFDLVLLVLTLISGFILYNELNKFNKLKSSYESLKQNIKESINSDFCNCSTTCHCKDNYIIFMESKGIDLI
ncbi:hypothetical protein [Clostridium scatologenes]|uniref:Uncharacterized protein n=1 Tax=Clostridium scatologenes TaxID=1548 RepID=A0A0E3M8W9_CLOSL|nr:hypothetical protein [Clostridium scatologenes]AKA72025.1 hypothetical protein CSCA_4900 [Clostridium scatologenes]